MDQAPQRPAAPDAQSVARRLAEAGLDVPAEVLDGVVRNLAVLDAHVDTVRAFGLDARSASALRFRP